MVSETRPMVLAKGTRPAMALDQSARRCTCIASSTRKLDDLIKALGADSGSLSLTLSGILVFG
jgi:hypothetical protein